MLKQYPFYIKCTIILFGLVLFSFSLFMLRTIMIPIAFGLMLAILLNPFVNRLQKWKVPRVVAISLSLLVAIILLGVVGYFLSTQIAGFSNQLPLLKKRMLELLQKLQVEITSRFNYNQQKQDQWLSDAAAGIKPFVGSTLMSIVGGIELLILIPLYTFLFLFYKNLIINFLYEVFAEENSTEVGVVLTQTRGAIQHYMFGLLLEAIIVATLNSIALLSLGVPYAILLAILGAMINVLPFIGGIVSISLPLIIATVTKDGIGTQIGILITYVIIQFTDNHFLIPYIVSSRVKINALCSIIIVLLGGAVWGVSGMFLAIPFVGILKIVFDRVPELQPWGKLLGDQIPTRHKGQLWSFRKPARTLPPAP